MSDIPVNNDEFFLGVMVQEKGGKWRPHSKFEGGAFGSALMKAEELDKEFDGVKVIRIPKSGKGEQKELWFSSKLKDKAEAAKAANLSKGMKESVENLRKKPPRPTS